MKPETLPQRSAPDRNEVDFYPTPEDVTFALFEWWKRHNFTPESVWEPACGDGRMVRVIKVLGIKCVGTDLYRDPSLDFLTAKERLAGTIVTNPPFSKAEQFIRKCLTFDCPFALLLKSQYWHASSRRALFERHRPIAVLPLTWRPDFLHGAKSGASTMEVYWTVWGSEPAERTSYEPLPRPVFTPSLFEVGE